MATTYKVRYKNHATPQEQIVSGGRYYLDSDVGKKMAGTCDTSESITTTGYYVDDVRFSQSGGAYQSMILGETIATTVSTNSTAGSGSTFGDNPKIIQISDTNSLAVGMGMIGTYSGSLIPANTYITQIDSGTLFRVNNDMTGTHGSASVTFAGGYDFVFIKNTCLAGTRRDAVSALDDITISLVGTPTQAGASSTFIIKLRRCEAFSTSIDPNSIIWVKPVGGPESVNPSIEYYMTR